MSTINDGGPAFPESGLSGLPNGEFLHGRAGMTLRDYFAAKALEGTLSSGRINIDLAAKRYAKDISESAYALADAMLKAREE
ncbi:hypothetical protein LMG26854_03348 [Achromobacter aegrifaciens]|uniref:hypothetical protein n=1 Tax=Achromobacter aegrifaciens TaxID=1287736 RepID=UPI0014673C2C|nr:hypothetical protein [Achromobacter aegrifaciens]CAB3858590.1 hypothetical protein LMG26854_03348 [Achromobacter aegrifaciens]